MYDIAINHKTRCAFLIENRFLIENSVIIMTIKNDFLNEYRDN